MAGVPSSSVQKVLQGWAFVAWIQLAGRDIAAVTAARLCLTLKAL